MWSSQATRSGLAGSASQELRGRVRRRLNRTVARASRAPADDDWICVAIDERRVEPHSKPPRSAVKIERRTIAHWNAVPTFKLHSDESANAGSPGRLDIRGRPRSGR
jgi:hypothetical protein